MRVELSQPELQVMEEFWNRGNLSIREVQESYPDRERPPYFGTGAAAITSLRHFICVLKPSSGSILLQGEPNRLQSFQIVRIFVRYGSSQN
jgi:hypothetical protein